MYNDYVKFDVFELISFLIKAHKFPKGQTAS